MLKLNAKVGWKLFMSSFMVPALFLGCGNYERESFRVETGKSYELTVWPDSLFIASLDSLFRSEPLKQPETTQRPEVSIDPTAGFRSVASGNNKVQAQSVSSPAALPGPPPSTGEMFAEKFMNALSALQSDPANPKLKQTVEVREGENLVALLVRVYGASARQMPTLMVESSLRSINTDVDLAHLKVGDTVRLPRIQ